MEEEDVTQAEALRELLKQSLVAEGQLEGPRTIPDGGEINERFDRFEKTLESREDRFDRLEKELNDLEDPEDREDKLSRRLDLLTVLGVVFLFTELAIGLPTVVVVALGVGLIIGLVASLYSELSNG